jgi:hypothetical protein
MTDQKPPRLYGDDRSTLSALLRYQRESFVKKVSGLGARESKASPVKSGTSLLWLTNHMADAESTWVLQRFAQVPDDELETGAAPTIEQAVARYKGTWEMVDAVVSDAPSLDASCPNFDGGPPVDLRWILCHLLEETARHAGHADILRELNDGRTGR